MSDVLSDAIREIRSALTRIEAVTVDASSTAADLLRLKPDIEAAETRIVELADQLVLAGAHLESLHRYDSVFAPDPPKET